MKRNSDGEEAVHKLLGILSGQYSWDGTKRTEQKKMARSLRLAPYYVNKMEKQNYSISAGSGH